MGFMQSTATARLWNDPGTRSIRVCNASTLFNGNTQCLPVILFIHSLVCHNLQLWPSVLVFMNNCFIWHFRSQVSLSNDSLVQVRGYHHILKARITTSILSADPNQVCSLL